jgi:hypothetical protein
MQDGRRRESKVKLEEASRAALSSFVRALFGRPTGD